MIPEVAPYVTTASENESVRQARESFRARHTLDVTGVLVVDVEERVAIRESEREFKVIEANGLVRLFMIVGVDSDGKADWVSKYVGIWLDTDSTIDDLIAMAA